MGGWKGSWMTTFKQAIIDALEKKYEGGLPDMKWEGGKVVG